MEYGKERYVIDRIIDSKRVLVTKDVDFFRPDKNNRQIIKKHVEKLKRFIEEDGQLNPIEVTVDGTVIDGHHRLLAIKSLKEAGNADLNIKYRMYEEQDLIDIRRQLELIKTKKGV